ncbi:MAG: acyltransferase domain-containing protein [Synechococcaceae cyanobacterium SM2_3_1]|nr:acyltransferase domain-containing protein [Synechococcaceae cyanobacterium SM2_3_1]
MILSLHHEEIPPHLHLQNPNPHVDWEHLPVKVPTQLMPWPRVEGEPRLAGLSSFGFSGTNVHVILEEAPAVEAVPSPAVERPLHLLTLAAKTEGALQAMAQSYGDVLSELSSIKLADLCLTANTGRTHFEQRLAVVTGSIPELRSSLTAFAQGERDIPGLMVGSVKDDPEHRIAFLFSGQGSQYMGMGRELYETQPTFKQALDQCAEILDAYLDQPLLQVLYGDQNTFLNATAYTQPALFALEYSLAQLWISWGIQPAILMGHSVGEYVAACLSGVFSLEDGLKLIAHRARLMQALSSDGAMVSVLADPETIQSAIAGYPDQVSIAAYNGPESVVFSGERQVVEAIARDLETKGTKVKQLEVSQAFHSPLMDPILDEFASVAREIQLSAPQIPVISNVTGQLIGSEIATAEYWVQHVRQPVKFAQGMQALQEQGTEIYLEVGPKPILLGMGRLCASEEDAGVWLPSLRPGLSDWSQILTSLAQLYVQGIRIDWVAFDRDYSFQKVSGLPTYPFQRERFWVEMSALEGESSLREVEPAQKSEETEVMQLISLGDTQKLSSLLAKNRQLSEIDDAVLRTILEALVAEHRQEAVALQWKKSWLNWLYKMDWVPQFRYGSLFKQLPSPTEIAKSIQKNYSEMMAQPEVVVYGQALARVVELCGLYIVTTFRGMGVELQPGETLSSAGDLAQRLGVVEKHQRLLGRLLGILVETGWLDSVDQGWRVTRKASSQDPTGQLQILQAQCPIAEAELILLERCGPNLASLLKGEMDPMPLLFPEGDLSTATKLYQDSPGAQSVNKVIRQTIQTILEQVPKQDGIRILEIGAGTGATTSFILPYLDPNRTEYVFTDIGTLFVTKARERFQDFAYVEYRTLDIGKDPATQGFINHHYDIIIAANALHATQYMRQTMQYVQQLLAPDGYIILLEGTIPIPWIDVTFGFTDGWWLFADQDLRPDYPLLRPDRWQQLLQETHFRNIKIVQPQFEDPNTPSLQAIIIAQAAKKAENLIPKKSWLLLSDRQGVGNELAVRLNRLGHPCIQVYSGHDYEKHSNREYTVNPTQPKHFDQLLTEIHPVLRSPYEIVNLWSLDSTGSCQVFSIDALRDATARGCTSTINLIKALQGKDTSSKPEHLWLITQGTQPGDGSDLGISGVMQSPLWGVGKSIQLEYPELGCQLVDLNQASPENIQILFEDLLSENSEDLLVYQGHQRYVTRLKPCEPISPQPATICHDRCYLITGGLDVQGMQVAKWLVEKGAKYLALTSQQVASPKSENELAELRSMGVALLSTQVDPALSSELERVLNEIQRSMPQLAGVIHTEGIAVAQPDSQQTPEHAATIEEQYISRATAAWNLHELTKDLELDFFVCFSSVASIWGAKQYPMYAGACHFLDTLAHYRHQLGLPALSLNWGLWKADSDTSHSYDQWMIQNGLEPIATEPSLAAMGHVLNTVDLSQVVIAAINGSRIKPLLELRKQTKLFEEIAYIGDNESQIDLDKSGTLDASAEPQQFCKT